MSALRVHQALLPRRLPGQFVACAFVADFAVVEIVVQREFRKAACLSELGRDPGELSHFVPSQLISEEMLFEVRGLPEITSLELAETLPVR